MGSDSKPSVYTIPAHRGFADALAAGLIDRFGSNEFELANGIILIPNNRAGSAINEAFVRRSEKGMLLPRMVTVGDLDLGESLGSALDSIGSAPDIPPAIHPTARIFHLAHLISAQSKHSGQQIDISEAVRLAREMSATIDQLLVEEIDPKRLHDLDVAPELSAHWQKSLDLFNIILNQWPDLLRKIGHCDAADRRNRLLRHVARRWKESVPPQYVVAAGITTAAPAIANLLKTVAHMASGMVVFPNLDLAMPSEEWGMLGPFEPETEGVRAKPSIETHPQFHLKLLLNRMSIARDEVMRWHRSGDSDAAPKRSFAISNAFAPAKVTGKWRDLESDKRSLANIEYIEAENSAEEAQAVALLIRKALEVPEKRVALITPNRQLATRVSAHLKRWNIDADDSAGQALSNSPSGVLLLTLLEAIASNFAPVELLALLKHPLVKAGEARLAWLDHVRGLDLQLRGPRPGPGLAGISAQLEQDDERSAKDRASLLPWWRDVVVMFGPLEAAAETVGQLEQLLEALKKLASDLTEGHIWSGPAGRALADLLIELEDHAAAGPGIDSTANLPALFHDFLSNVAVRAPYGGHPRVSIYGLLEARLQQSDLVICGGMNEGSWPQIAAPDPWLAPMVRRELGLSALEWRVGLSAHDLASAMGAPAVVITRAKREGGSPAIASRFLLRLRAMAGENFRTHPDNLEMARELDNPKVVTPATRPAPLPTAKQRRVQVAVTDMDRLKADPFAFYARKILLLGTLDAVDADPSAAWRGTIVHDVLEKWALEDDYDTEKLKARIAELLDDASAHPLTRALWQPRLVEAINWVAEQLSLIRDAGREPRLVEEWGSIELAGVTLGGKVDRLDILPDGGMAIVDYKTGQPPSTAAIKAGYSLQLGLLGLIAERDGFKGVNGVAKVFEYWSLAKNIRGNGFGFIKSPVEGRSANQRIEWEEFTAHAAHHFIEAAELWIKGAEPFTAKLHPEHASYSDYDQLMRADEWYGREGDKA